jgi:ABC-type antimicrobial peptide transport system permease subunit
MKNLRRTLLLLLSIALSVLSCYLILAVIHMMRIYSDNTMGNEANGFFSFFVICAISSCVLTSILWIVFLKSSRKEKSGK